MADRTITTTLRLNIQDMQGKLRKAGQDVKSFGMTAERTIQRNRAQWASLSTGIGLAGVAMIGFAALSVKTAADFDKSMSKVRSTGDDAAQNIDGLRKAALKAGADTMFSAVEAADGVTDLVKAGRTAAQVMGGDLTGTLALAAAGEMGVADASERAANIMNMFGDSAGSVVHVADLLVMGANAASGEVTDLSDALQNVGPVAAGMGLSLEETIGFLTEMAYTGKTGAEAGTQFRSMLLSLSAPSSTAKKAMSELNLSMFDSQGRTKTLTQFIEEYRASLNGKTDAEKASYDAIIFGTYGINAAKVAYDQAGGSLDQWVKRINEQGAAQRQAAILTDNLAGDIERLGGSLDTVFIQSGTGANDVLRKLAQNGEALVNVVGELPAPLLESVTLIAGAGGLGLAGSAGMMKLVGAIVDARDTMRSLGTTGRVTRAAVAGVGVALSVGAVALAAWANAQARMAESTQDFSSTLVIVDGVVARTDATISELNRKLAEDQWTNGMWGLGAETAIQRANELDIASEDLAGYVSGVGDAHDRVKAKLDEKDNIWAWMSGGSPESTIARDTAKQLRTQLDEYANSLTDAEKAAAAKYQADKSAGVGVTIYAEAQQKANAAGSDGVSILKSYAQQQFEIANAALKASGSEIGWQAALDDTTAAIKKNGRAARTASGDLDLNTAKGRANQTQLNQLATASLSRVQAMIEESASEDDIRSKLERSRKQFISNATAAGMTSEAAKRLADRYELIPDVINTDVNLRVKWTGQLSKKISVDGTGAGKVTLRAAGGAVTGPGTGTSDSIPVMMSNGEHVLTASDVTKAGGHEAIYRMRAGIQAGLLHFRNGGGFATGGAAKERARERRTLLEELKRNLARGEISSSFTSGSGMSVVDEILNWAQNDALSKSARSKLRKQGLAAESRLLKLTKRLDQAQATLDKVQQVYDDARNALGSSGSGLGDLVQGTMQTDMLGNISYAPASAASMVSKKRGEAADLKNLVGKLSKLRKAGASAAFLSEIAGLATSPDGVKQAISISDMYLADTSQISSMNAAYKEMESLANQGAQYVSEASYKGGLSAAKGLVDKLNSEMESIGSSLAKAFAGALGYKMTKKGLKKRAGGGPVEAGELYQVNEQGVELFRPALSGVILTASQTAQAALPQGPSLAQFSDAQVAYLARMIAGAVASMTVAQQRELAQAFRYGQGSW